MPTTASHISGTPAPPNTVFTAHIKPFHPIWSGLTWENSSARVLLNHTTIRRLANRPAGLTRNVNPADSE
jgi:hypothetical protein